MPPLAPAVSQLGPYRLERLAGVGATARVYRATDLRTGDLAAVKLLNAVAGPLQPPTQPQQPQQLQEPPAPPQAHSAPEALERVRLAHATLAGLTHPHIVKHLDAGYADGCLWLAYEWATGCDLTRYVLPRWLLPTPLVLALASQLASGLAHAHRSGWLHRDLKPSNVRVHLPSTSLKLTDFGIAKATTHTESVTGVLLGTPRYMAPELLLGESPSIGSDLYALGVMLYELLSGSSPHEATTLQALLRQTLQGQAKPLAAQAPGLPPALTSLVHAMIERQPGARPGSADAVMAELQDLCARPASCGQ